MSMCGERGEREARGGRRRLAATTFLSRENRSAKARRFPSRISFPHRWAHPPNPGRRDTRAPKVNAAAATRGWTAITVPSGQEGKGGPD